METEAESNDEELQDALLQTLRIPASGDTLVRGFVDKLEFDIFDQNDNFYIRECYGPISEPFSSPELGVSKVFEVLDENYFVVFKLAKCYPKKNVLNFIILIDDEQAVLSLTRGGFCGLPKYKVEGAGILSFTQVVKIPLGYTLEDPYKKLLNIRTSWVPLFPFLLLNQKMTATMKIADLDGSTTGTIRYAKPRPDFNCSRCLCLQFNRGLDRKAKYMVFAACLLPLSNYFFDSGKLWKSLWLLVLYTVVLGVVVAVVCWRLL